MTDLKEATKTPDIVSMLEWRYATKQFDPERKIESSTWDKLEKALVLSPSSYGLQPWNFVVVTDQSIKEKLANNSFQQPQSRDCSHLVVISRLESIDETYVENYLELISETRGIPKDKLADYKNMMLGFINRASQEEIANWMAKQCYIALGNILTTAAVLQVDACPMAGFDKNAYDEILNLPEKGLKSVVLAALGYRHQEDKYAALEKVRHPVSDVVLHI